VNLEYYSSLALVASVVVYVVAMFLHAAEWAAARRVVAEPAVAEPELVAVGAEALAEPGKLPESAEGPPDGRQRVETFGRMGVSLTVLGFLLSVAGVVFRGLAAERAPWGNMFEFTISAMVFVVAVYLIMVWRAGVRWLGLPVTLLAAIGNGLAITVFYVAVAPLVPALHSVWFVIHIVAAAISGAAFNVGGLLSILYLVKKRGEDRGRIRGYLAWLPTPRRIDVLAYRFHAFAFPLWTFTVAAGAIWAEYAWGRYWGWDPKETWALVTWVIYACYLHARSTAGWRGRRAAMIAIVGLASFWFNFIGINLLVSGLHSYAGI
jgi:cytochrome c-type biogenesis protein CcsB